MTQPTVSTLWIGPTLSWIEQLSLASFLAVGHKVKLYSYGPVEGVPHGVDLADASQIFVPDQYLVENSAPSMIADLFRIMLVQLTDEVWVDTDMVAVKPLTVSKSGFAIAYESPGRSICNAVLGAPRHSAALRILFNFIQDPHIEPEWLRPALRDRLSNVPRAEILGQLYKVKRTSMGPLALAHALRVSGEITEVRPRAVYFSVPWQFAHVLFNPHGGMDGWMSEDTEAVHLWAHALSGYHKSHQPHPTSFVGTMLSQLEIDVSQLKRQKC